MARVKGEKECDVCSEIFRIKNMKKINQTYYCHSCHTKYRRDKRKKLIEESLDKEIIKELDKKIREEMPCFKRRKEYARKYYLTKRKKQGNEYKEDKTYEPKIKKKVKIKSNSYITLEERQNILRILMSRGMDFEEAKERISNLIKEQRRVRTQMIEEGKKEGEINKYFKEAFNELTA